MKLLSADQIREAEHITIKEKKITSLQLMQFAARVFTRWFTDETKKDGSKKRVLIFCGPGNNGGDGLNIAINLIRAKKEPEIYLLSSSTLSEDFRKSLGILENQSNRIHHLNSRNDFPEIQADDLIIDALFGSSLNRPLAGVARELVFHLNKSKAKIFSVDIPSGMFADAPTTGQAIHAHATLSFQQPKPAFMFPFSEQFTGRWAFRSIGLSPVFLSGAATSNFYITRKDAQLLLRPRKKFDHKGKFGHVLIVAGSTGKTGAAILAARAALKSGCGLATVLSNRSGISAIHAAVPEAMTKPDKDPDCITEIAAEENITAAGVGPGIGKSEATYKALKKFLSATKLPLVLDADALNIIAERKLNIPAGSIITPHPKEFERLFGKSKNEFDRYELQRNMAVKLNCTIILKGAHTCIALPDGTCWFNSSGNPGLAKGGSGDVLTGMIASMLAQGYSAGDAAKLGVWLHGAAADIALKKTEAESMTASDVIACIPRAFRMLKNRPLHSL